MDIYDIETQGILERIARHCPEAMIVYFHCINRMSEDGSVFFTHKQIEDEMCESWAKFRNGLKKLALENLLEWHYFNDGLAITLLGYDD